MQKIHKEIILGAAVVLLSVFCWWFLKYVFYIGGLTAGCWIFGGILFILFGIALCLAMLFIDNKAILFSSFILAVALFFIFFNNKLFYYFIVLILLFLSFWLAANRIKKEEEVQVNLNFWRIWKRGLPWLITVLCLLIALVYYFSPELVKIHKKQFTIPRDTFNLVISPIEGLIKERLPQEVVNLDAEATKILTSEQIKELEQKYEIEIKQGESIKDLLYKLVNFQINKEKGPYEKFIPIGLAVGLFLGLRIIGFFYVAVVIMLSWLVLKILIALKFAKLEKVQKEVETVKL